MEKAFPKVENKPLDISPKQMDNKAGINTLGKS
jgi:hypothetical protein